MIFLLIHYRKKVSLFMINKDPLYSNYKDLSHANAFANNK